MGALTRAGGLLLVEGVVVGQARAASSRNEHLTLTNRTSSVRRNGEGLGSSQAGKCSRVE